MPKHPGGRPTKYRPEFAPQAEKLCRLGAVNGVLAEFFDVSVVTLRRWAAEYPEFCTALEVGVEAANVQVRRSLFHKAVGYDYAEQQAVKLRDRGADGSVTERVEVVEVQKHCPADTTAIKFWLVNKDPKNFRDVQRTEHTGAEGGPIETVDLGALSDEDLAVLERLAAKLPARDPDPK